MYFFGCANTFLELVKLSYFLTSTNTLINRVRVGSSTSSLCDLVALDVCGTRHRCVFVESNGTSSPCVSLSMGWATSSLCVCQTKCSKWSEKRSQGNEVPWEATWPCSLFRFLSSGHVLQLCLPQRPADKHNLQTIMNCWGLFRVGLEFSFYLKLLSRKHPNAKKQRLKRSAEVPAQLGRRFRCY